MGFTSLVSDQTSVYKTTRKKATGEESENPVAVEDDDNDD